MLPLGIMELAHHRGFAGRLGHRQMRLGNGVQERPKNQVKVRRVKKVASEKPVVNGENSSQIRWIGPEKKVDITVNFAYY